MIHAAVQRLNPSAGARHDLGFHRQLRRHRCACPLLLEQERERELELPANTAEIASWLL